MLHEKERAGGIDAFPRSISGIICNVTALRIKCADILKLVSFAKRTIGEARVYSYMELHGAD